MASHKPIGEFDVIHQIRDIVGPRYGDDVLIGIGDDAAAYRIAGDTAHVIATDALVEGEHFDRAFYLLEDVGYKAMAVNLSDIAAMNATPEYATIALGMPAGTSLQDIAAVYEGLNECARHYGVRIVGGDTVRAPLLMLSITVVGATPIEKLAIRGGARPGDLLCVTGTLGAGKAGLDVLRRGGLQTVNAGMCPVAMPSFNTICARGHAWTWLRSGPNAGSAPGPASISATVWLRRSTISAQPASAEL